MSEPDKLARNGSFFRTSDRSKIQRYKCLECKRGFSLATLYPCYRQNKRHKNELVRELLCSSVSQRRTARITKLNRKTVVRKFLFLAAQAELKLNEENSKAPLCKTVEFDDLETAEHTKCKPLSVTLAVEHRTRRILGAEVSQMPPKGLLVHIAKKKYGPRKDMRRHGRRKLFQKIKSWIEPDALIKSDQNPHYPQDVFEHFPKCQHKVFKGRRGAVVGQGELKKIGFDPLFSLNHTCASLRANINRLVRKTWCTTKRPDRLAAHIILYAEYHNENLPKRA